MLQEATFTLLTHLYSWEKNKEKKTLTKTQMEVVNKNNTKVRAVNSRKGYFGFLQNLYPFFPFAKNSLWALCSFTFLLSISAMTEKTQKKTIIFLLTKSSQSIVLMYFDRFTVLRKNI